MEGHKTRILVVDDEKSTASMIRKLLENKLDAGSCEANDAASAREQLAGKSFDAVTLDYSLPDCLDLELLRDIKSQYPQTAVIIVTGMGDEALAARAMLEGADGYVVKDESLATLLPRAVENAIGRVKLAIAEETAGEQEQFYRALFEQSRDAVFVETFDGLIEDANMAACEMTGLTVEELRGKYAREMVPASRLNGFDEAAARIRAGETVQFTNVRRDGTAFPIEISAAEVGSGDRTRYIVTIRDVSGQKRAEEALHNVIRETNQRREEITALLESTRYVLEHSDFKESARTVFDICRKLIGAEAGYVGLVEEEGALGHRLLFMQPSGAHGDTEGELRMPLNLLSEKTFKSGKPVFENDLAGEWQENEMPEGHFAVRNILFSPLLVDGAVAGIIGLANKPGGFTKRDALMAAAFGEIASLALRNSVVLEQLEDSEKRFRSVAESAGEAIICGDSHGRIVFWNDGAEIVFGYRSEEVIGEPLTILMPERFRDENIARMRHVRKHGWEGEPGRTYEQEVLRKDGSEVPVEITVSSWTVSGELFFTVIARDVSERKRADEELRASEQRFRTAAWSASDLIWDWDFATNVLEWFGDIDSALGYGPGEFPRTIEAWENAIHPDERDRVLATLENSIETRSRYSEFYRVATRDGKYRYWVDEGECLLDTEGKPYKMVGACTDVTDRHMSEQKLRESEELYRTLIQMSPDAVTVTDLKGNIIDTSQRTIELHGADSLEDLLSLNAFDLIAAEDQERAMANLKRTLEEDVLRNLEYTLVRKNGSTFIGEMNAALLKDAEGNPRAFMATVRDITDRKQAERDLQNLNVELEGYAHTVSHDLRGPLASILAASSVLQAMLESAGLGDSEEIMDIAGVIAANVGKAESLIEDLLYLAEAGQMPSEIAEVEVRRVLDQVFAELKQEIDDRGVRIEIEDDLGKIRANPTQLYQLFSNLLRNAIKHNDNTRPVVQIRYFGRLDDGHRYLVKDNGSGINPEDLDSIFLPFFKGPGGDTGIGLVTVDKIVKTYGGNIRAFNDGGACFEFSIQDL